ncbi:MAG: DUF1653 domain-containing protein [Lachnospiraceae bacterium]|nr:DUF1653 domain-containing protein [Lachnospiraceae bacterium]
MPQGDPRPGEKYLHFKNKLYQVIAVAHHAETGEKMVVYQALYGTFQSYVRPLSMFVSLVDKQKYPTAQQKYRFQWVEFKKAGTELPKPKGAEKLPQEPEAPVEQAAEKEPSKEPVMEKLPQEPGPSKENTAQELLSDRKAAESTPEEKMMAFFDADTIEEKYKILLGMRDDITDRMINNMAVVMDVVVEEGPLDLRYEELKACLRTMQRYECSRLR